MPVARHNKSPFFHQKIHHPANSQISFREVAAVELEAKANSNSMTNHSTSSSSLRRLLITAACVLQLWASQVSARQSSSSSHQPSTAVDNKWVTEEEFFGASDISNIESDVDHSWWDEDDDTDEEEEEGIYHSESELTSKDIPSERRRHRWRRKRRSENKQHIDQEQSGPSFKQTDRDIYNDEQQISQYDEEHPMRTDEWELDIHLSRLFAQEGDKLFPECFSSRDGRSNAKHLNSNRYRKKQKMTFANNGYVKVSAADDDQNRQGLNDNSSSKIPTLAKKPLIGKWRIGHSGVAFDIPVQMSVTRKLKGNNSKVKEPKMTTLHYHADIHLNKFGERPRMFRGVITRDRYVNSRI